MKIVLAVSNPPTRQFMWNRHNVGSLFITEYLIKKYQTTRTEHPKYISFQLNKQPHTFLCVSKTYMNLSGQVATSFFKKNPPLSIQRLIAVQDDLEHKFGSVRIKQGGSHQGHNGILSLIGAMGGKQFKRLQLGIDRPVSRDPDVVAKYVLQNFSNSQRDGLLQMFVKAEQALKKISFL